MKYLFFFLAFLSVLSALMVIISRNAVHSVLYLIITFFAIAGLYILPLQAEFLGVVQAIVYAGAIMVLFLFVIMMLNLNKETEPAASSNLIKFAGAISGGMLVFLIIASFKGAVHGDIVTSGDKIGQIQVLGKVLFQQFTLPLEVASLLFLAAMVGAVMLGKKEIQ
jgi:NADH-quinone oxidoreductase subunit J